MTRNLPMVLALLVTGLVAAPVAAQSGAAVEPPARSYTGPIIDMHLHGYTEASFPERVPPNPATGRPGPGTAREHMERSIEVMRRHHVVLGAICSVPADGRAAMDAWAAYAPDRVLRGIAPDDPTDFMDPSEYRQLARDGGVDVACEVGSQYVGYSPSDPAYGPYWSIAEELGIPVGIHTGTAPPPHGPEFRLRFGNPLLIETMLAEHPGLKVYMMHAGAYGPFMDYALMMMGAYPRIYADIGVLTWIPGAGPGLGEFLRKAKTWGVLDRVMFGTDQMFWPEAIELAIERVDGYDFLTVEEKAGIFYDNAARFLGLSEDVVARHREIAERGATR